MVNVNESYWVLLLIVSIFCFIGVIFLCIGFALSSREKKKRNICTQSVMATVVDIQHRAVGASSCTDPCEVKMMSWFPIYEYVVDEKVKRNRAFIGTSKPEVSIGQKVLLYINPEHPDEFYCPEEKSALIRKIFTGVGISCIGAAVIVVAIFYSLMK